MKLRVKGIVLSGMVFGAFAVGSALGQTTPPDSASDRMEQPPEPVVTTSATPLTAPAHSFTSVRDIELGMTVDQVKAKLGKPDVQDDTGLVFDLGKGDSVQIGLDPEKKVRTIAAIFAAESNAAPSFMDVFGTAPASDGDVYKLERYPDEGYWVSYSRTITADKPVTVVMIRKIF